MKQALFILFYCFLFFIAPAQRDSIRLQQTVNTPVKKPVLKAQQHKKVISDSFKVKAGAESALVKSNFADTGIVPIADSPAANIDTAKKIVTAVVIKHPVDSFYLKLLDNPFFRYKGRPAYLVINERVRISKDEMFYLLLGLLFILAVIKLGFSHYFINLFRQFFQPSFRQKQTREQLSQNNFPSLLLNLFFIISGGAFIALLMQYYHLSVSDFKTNFAYSTLALLLLYTGKFILLTFAGWVFNAKEATETYIFIVFLVNKIMGIMLLPFAFIIAFSKPGIINVSVTASLMFIFILFLYRYVAAIIPVRRDIKISVSHFIFYILAFEIMPLLLIYKTLGIYLGKSA